MEEAPTPEINASGIDPTLWCHTSTAIAVIKGKVYGKSLESVCQIEKQLLISKNGGIFIHSKENCQLTLTFIFNC